MVRPVHHIIGGNAVDTPDLAVGILLHISGGIPLDDVVRHEDVQPSVIFHHAGVRAEALRRPDQAEAVLRKEDAVGLGQEDAQALFPALLRAGHVRLAQHLPGGADHQLRAVFAVRGGRELFQDDLAQGDVLGPRHIRNRPRGLRVQQRGGQERQAERQRAEATSGGCGGHCP